MALAVRFQVIYHPDTEDHQEALDETRDLMQMIRDSWYGAIQFGEEVRVIEVSED
jgi:flagellin-specific chaperone FliS